MIISYGTINRLLIVAAVSTITATAASPSLRCPRLCQCSNEGQGLTILCSDIRLNSFPVDIPMNIKYLDVSSNSISNVSYKDLSRFPLLEYFDLSSNNIQDLSSEIFSSLTLLKKLDLSFNNIKEFHPNTFIHNRILAHLSIRGNPLQIASKSPVLASKSLRSLELDLDTWSENTFKNLISLDQLIVHWKKGISMSRRTFEPLYRLLEFNIICKEMCDEKTFTLSPDLKYYFDKKGVKIIFNVTTFKQMVRGEVIATYEERGHNQETVETSSQRPGADEEQNDSPHIGGPVASIIPVPVSSVEDNVSVHKGSILTRIIQESTDEIEIGEILKNKFSGSDSITTSQSPVIDREVDKEQAPEDNENNKQIRGHEKIIFATNGIIIMLLILIFTLILSITVCFYIQKRGRHSHNVPKKPVASNVHSVVEKAVPHYEHVYEEPKDVDSRLFYHIYYDHNAPLLPHRPHLRPPVPPRPVGYYAVPYDGERR